MQYNDIINDSRMLGIDRYNNIYKVAGQLGGTCIDAGAAAGMVTEELLNAGADNILCFEPFPGNHPHFLDRIENNPKVQFFKKAVSDFNGQSDFFVASTVQEDVKTHWGSYVGYSSLGYLTDQPKSKDERSMIVDTVRLEDYIDDDITLLKMDLQGGEIAALKGLGSKLDKVKACYVEFEFEWDILEFLYSNNFIVFDSIFTGIPKSSTDKVKGFFTEMHLSPLSNGLDAVSGYLLNTPRHLTDYKDFLLNLKEKHFANLWTDVIAIRPEYLPEFFTAAQKISRRKRP